MTDPSAKSKDRRLRFGMVGGGRGSQIGDSHRIAARMDGYFDLVAGAFDIVPERGRAFASELGVAEDRAYSDYEAMARAEAERSDGVDIVAVTTPNNTHYKIANVFLNRGIHVICEKPLTTSTADALALVRQAREKDLICAVMYGYSGYPMVRQARAMVAAGELGKVRVVQTEFAHGGMAAPVERDDPAAAWRFNPEIAGPTSVLGDTGTHALHLATYIIDSQLSAVAAELTSQVAGRQLEDNAHVMLRFDNGATGTLWASAVAVGNLHGLRIRIYSDKGGLEWRQERPNQLIYSPLGEPTRTLERGSPALHPLARRGSRISAGHPEGYFEAFTNVYSDVAEVLLARLAQRDAEPLALEFPNVEDGARGVRFLDAAVESSTNGGRWTDATLNL